MAAVEPIFYADTTAGVNIQLSVAEENFSRAPSVIQRKRNVYELLCMLPPGASAGGEAVDHANFALGSSRATGAVRARRTAGALRSADSSTPSDEVAAMPESAACLG
jgi:hypothetical protein